MKFEGSGPDPVVAPADVMDVLPVGVAVVLLGGDVLSVNTTMATLLELTTVPGPERGFAAWVPERQRPNVHAALAKALAGTDTRVTFDLDGSDRSVELEIVGRTWGTPERRVAVVVAHDVSHRLARELDLEHRATHDALTGLPNRAWLLDHVHGRLDRGDPIVMAFVDLDRFKAVNDELGHEAGDAVLSDVAVSLSRCLHAGEVTARVGGDEFVVISMALDEDQLADFDQRIRLAVATVPSARNHQVGVSVGVVRAQPDDEPWSLLRRADAAMYQQKRRLERRSGRTDRRRRARDDGQDAEPPADAPAAS